MLIELLAIFIHQNEVKVNESSKKIKSFVPEGQKLKINLKMGIKKHIDVKKIPH